MSPRTIPFAAAVWAGLIAGSAEASDTLQRVSAGSEYRASAVQKFFAGSGWRGLWTTPIEVPILDLSTEAGGLKPVKRLGGLQSVILAMEGADGRSYTFRSVNKDLSRLLPPAYRGTLVGRTIQDQVSAGHPVPNLIVTPLAIAAGVPTTTPRLVMMPDDPALGEYRADFAGMLGTIEEYPTPSADGRAGFLAAEEIVSTTDLWKRWMEGPEGRADSRAFARARLFDLFINDWDRHRTQWRWARSDSLSGYQPIPEDRDMAFSNFGGLLVGMAGPLKLSPFGTRIPWIGGLSYSNSDIDRWILSDLERDDFLSVATELQNRLNDEVIWASLAAMPGPYHEVQSSMASRLRGRRDRLVETADRYYDHLAGEVDVHGTDRAEVARLRAAEDGSVELTISRLPEGGGVSLATASTNGAEDQAYYRRRFVRGETDEIRVYLHGGDDRFEATDPEAGWLSVHVIGGPGSDQLEDAGWKIRFHEVESADAVRGSGGTHIDRSSYRNPVPFDEAPWREPRNWGRDAKLGPLLGWHGDDQLTMGVGYENKSYGFRYYPYARRHRLKATYLSGPGAFRLDYEGEFRRPNSNAFAGLDAGYGPSDRRYFFGLGNETPRTGGRNFYRTHETEASIFAAAAYESRARLRIRVGPQLKYLTHDNTEIDLLNQLRPYGSGSFLQAGVRGEIDWDRRNRLPAVLPGEDSWTKTNPDRLPLWSGHRITIGARAYPALGDVESHFAGVQGSAVGLIALGNRLCLASRVAGEKVWGNQPWHESAFIGGSNSLRSYSRDRFAGDASALGSVELRARLGRSSFVMPANFGVLAFADAGRVFLTGESSNLWHPAFGGGVFFAPVALNMILQLTFAKGDEGSKIYAGSGFAF